MPRLNAVERSRKKGRLSCLSSELVFRFLGITLAIILLALVMSFALLLNSSRKRKRDRGVDEEQSERKLFDKSCSPTSSFLDALGRSFQIPGLTLGTVNKLQFSGKQYFSAKALNLLSMGFLEFEKALLILLANASDTLRPRHSSTLKTDVEIHKSSVESSV